jgi:hypothetical protein
MLVDAHIPELLAAHKVDLLLSGHDHIYERGAGYGGTKYLISGGGGAPLYRIAETVRTTRKAEAAYHFVEVTTSGDALRIVARRLDGTLIDRCGFRRGSDWDCDRQEITGPAPEPSPVVAAPPPTAVSPSRCSCDLPGARANSAGFAVLVLGSAVGSMLAGARVRSSRRRG